MATARVIPDRARADRAVHALLALAATAGLVLEYLYSLSLHPDMPLIQSARYVSFFTIQSNALVLITALAHAGGRAPSAGWRAALTVYITVVAAIFQALLAARHHFTGVGWWGNLLAHQVVPGLWLVSWLWFGPHGGTDRLGPWRWLIYPLAYTGWTMAVGATTGWFPYFFLDPARSGWGVIAYVVGIAALFLGLGFAVRWIDGRLALRAAR